VSKSELLERESRGRRPAGLAAIGGALLFALSIVLQQSGFEGGGGTADELSSYHDHASTLLISSIIGAIGFALFCIPLYFLFRAASARSDRVRRAFVAFAFIGPILFSVGQVVATAGIGKAADKFVDQAPAVERQAPDTQATGGDEATTGDQTTTDGGQTATEAAKDAKGEKGEETVTANTESTETTTGSDSSSDDDDPEEKLADDLVDDESLISTGTSLRIPGIFGLLVGMIYIPLWAMRTGLMTRFWSSLGMALGVSILLLGPIGIFMLVIWFAAIGLQLAGWWPGGRPPAWEAGIAIPWPRAGDPDPDTTLEGSGRELEDDAGDGGMEGPDVDSPASGNGAPPQGPPPRKRKRRR